jgi:hypothetical protein
MSERTLRKARFPFASTGTGNGALDEVLILLRNHV